MFPNQRNRLFQSVFSHSCSMTHNDGLRTFNLIVEEFTEVLDEYSRLLRINNGNQRIDLHVFKLQIFNSFHDIRQLTNTRRLNQNSFRSEVIDHLLNRLTKIAY